MLPCYPAADWYLAFCVMACCAVQVVGCVGFVWWFFFKLMVRFWSFAYVKDGILEFAVWFLLKTCVGMLVWWLKTNRSVCCGGGCVLNVICKMYLIIHTDFILIICCRLYLLVSYRSIYFISSGPITAECSIWRMATVQLVQYLIQTNFCSRSTSLSATERSANVSILTISNKSRTKSIFVRTKGFRICY
jgi:hypothetical protein